jgi:hypothetical protein
MITNSYSEQNEVYKINILGEKPLHIWRNLIVFSLLVTLKDYLQKKYKQNCISITHRHEVKHEFMQSQDEVCE